MIPVKICGITTLADALLCCSAGVTALGFVLAPSSRRVSPEQVAAITRQLPPFITKVGVFVNEDPGVIREIMKECRLDLAQLHGEESPDWCERLDGRVIKAFKAGRDFPDSDWNKVQLYGVLIDSYSGQESGGTGKAFDWNLFKCFRKLGAPLILAGGLNPANLGEALRIARPDSVDVSSGVEISPGIKDPFKVRQFMALARKSKCE